MDEKIICYVCKKEMRPAKPYISIGKNLKGIILYRHKKCNPNSLTKKQTNECKNCKEIK